MKEISIRKATMDDLPVLLRFEQAMIDAERPLDPAIKREKTNYYDLEKLIAYSRTELLVAESNGEIIGTGYAQIRDSSPYLQHAEHSYLGFMYVVPEFRGKGVNKSIVDALCSWSLEQNVPEIRLEVYVNNAAAIRAYEKVGFEPYLLEMRAGINIGESKD